MLSLTLLSFVACLPASSTDAVVDPSSDDDGDGLTYEQEEQYGTDPDSNDSDADGLLDADEIDMGTDPLSADSDLDGFADADEVSAGTNPRWQWSHTFEKGDYLIGNCPVFPDESNSGPTGVSSYDGVTPAYQEGDIMHNVAEGGIDMYGQEVPVYSFCGNYTLITESAEWCGPCNSLADTMADDTKTVRRKYPNFTFYELVYQDNYGETSDASVLTKWNRSHGLDGIPVTAPSDQTNDEVGWLCQGGGIPSTTLVAPDMTVIWSSLDHPGSYYLSSALQIKEAIQAYEDSLQ